MRTRTLLPFASALLIAGCVTAASVSMATADSDASAKTFTPPDGKANLYIAWSGSSNQKASFDVSVDGKSVGPIAPGTFYLLAMDPGRHSITVAARMSSARETLTSEAGKNYFYEVTANSTGLMAKPSLGFVLIPEMGKIMVRQNKRAQGASE